MRKRQRGTPRIGNSRERAREGSLGVSVGSSSIAVVELSSVYIMSWNGCFLLLNCVDFCHVALHVTVWTFSYISAEKHSWH